ncbi:MAG: hypothetical protein FVQ79_08405 [Planctomycetes bacterium]|nr:hypothetical protein [Planctomycetota bacterium]
MRTIQILSILFLLSMSNAQESEPVHKGSDYFRLQPGKSWYIDGRAADGQQLSMYRRYSIKEHVSATSSQVPVTIESFMYGRLFMEVTEIYRIKPNGAIEHEKTIQNGRFHTYDPPNVYLPTEMRIGTQWSIKERSGDVFQMSIEEFLDELKLPNGLIFNDVVKVKRDYQSESGESLVYVYEYYGKGMGYIGGQFSNGHLFELLKPRVIEGSEALQSL